ncbi:MAG: acyl-CoA dehydrogenase family protein [Alphaproteobacteria bacterium]|nr:acyl-CoA dehydrogenase family protein [Alphaproteobacteria bacterium]
MLLSESHRLIRDAMRHFARDRLMPGAAARDAESRFPAEEMAEIGALGLLGMTVPTEWGGAGADTLALALAIEEIAYADASCATIMSGHNCVGCMPLLHYGTEEQKRRFLVPMANGEMLSAFALTEPQGGSDNAAMTTRARKSTNSYILSGTKQFITSGSTAQIALVFAVTDPDAGRRGISAFLVPTNSKGWVVSRKESKLGQRASDTCEIILDDIELDHGLLLGKEGEGLKIALSNLEGGRIGIAALAIGIAQAAFDAALAYARERISFGKPILEHQAVGFRLAAMATRIESARQLTHHAAVLRDTGQPCLKEACMAKLLASETAEQVCSDAIQTFGGNGYLTDYPVERLYRDARVTRIYEGTNDIQHMVIARELTRS